MFELIKNFKFTLILLATFISSVGTGITSIALPWVFVNEKDGVQAFGYTMLMISFLLFFLSPYVGSLIDRYSRKHIFCYIQLACGFILGIILFLGITKNHYELWHLSVLSFTGAIFFFLTNPTVTALIQEIFPSSQYSRINSLLEMVRQTAPVICGGLSVYIIEKISFTSVIFMDLSTYLLSFFCFCFFHIEKRISNLFVKKEFMVGYEGRLSIFEIFSIFILVFLIRRHALYFDHDRKLFKPHFYF